MNSQELASFHAGDDALFRMLVHAHSPRLLHVAMALMRDSQAAEDVVHDAWVRAFERRATYSASGSFIGWMLMIVRNLAVERWRSTRRDINRFTAVHDLAEHQAVLANADGDHAAYDDHSAYDGALRPRAHLVIEALARLTVRQRDVVTLRLLEGVSVDECAGRLHVAPGTVKATLHQALEKLRNHLTSDPADAPHG